MNAHDRHAPALPDGRRSVFFPLLQVKWGGEGSKSTTCEDFGCLQEETDDISFPRGMLFADLSQAVCGGQEQVSWITVCLHVWWAKMSRFL